jgi:hypothetical protein
MWSKNSAVEVKQGTYYIGSEGENIYSPYTFQ